MLARFSPFEKFVTCIFAVLYAPHFVVFARLSCRQTGVLAASLPTIKDYMKIVQAVKTRALAALHDVTHLPGRPDGHVDVKDGLRASRITVKSFLRPEFAALSDTQQEAYVYRLAR